MNEKTITYFYKKDMEQNKLFCPRKNVIIIRDVTDDELKRIIEMLNGRKLTGIKN